MKTYETYFKDQNLIPRPQQAAALEWISDNWDRYDYFILQLPTGVGKTHFALGATMGCRNTWIATSTIQLMEQYLHTNSGIVDIKGRGNYDCHVVDSASCEFGPCLSNPSILQNCKQNNFCAYENQKNRALSSKWPITNYSYLIYCAHCGFLSSNNPSGMPPPPREISIFDEAHNLEKHLISFGAQIYDFDNLHKYKHLKKHYKVSNDIWENVDLLTDICGEFQGLSNYLQEEINRIYKTIGKKFKGDKYSSSETQKVQKMVSQLKTVDRFLQPLKFWMETRSGDPNKDQRWIIHPNLEENTLQLAPLKSDFIFNYYFNQRISDKFIFMSATIGDPEVFCEENGIPKDRAGFFETDSPFDPKKSPIFVLSGRDSVNTRFGELDKNLGKIVSTITKIMDTHSNDGGIIHTGNYKIARHIWNNIPNRLKERILFREMDGNDMEIKNIELVRRHEDRIRMGEPSVLLSPSLMEGVDLKDDLSRFQIVVKLPFSSLGDPRVKKKTEINPKWYRNDMAMKLVQSCGRSTRTESDWSRTYIIDDMFAQILNQAKFPLWFKNRIIFIKD